MKAMNVSEWGTPGPWRIRRKQGRGYRIYAPGNRLVVADVPPGHPADAFIIAAAPDLLAAALRVSIILENREVEGIEEPRQALDAAIAAAMPMLPVQRADGLPREE